MFLGLLQGMTSGIFLRMPVRNSGTATACSPHWYPWISSLKFNLNSRCLTISPIWQSPLLQRPIRGHLGQPSTKCSHPFSSRKGSGVQTMCGTWETMGNTGAYYCMGYNKQDSHNFHYDVSIPDPYFVPHISPLSTFFLPSMQRLIGEDASIPTNFPVSPPLKPDLLQNCRIIARKRVDQSIENQDNQRLYPDLMGPHYVYTLEHPLEIPTAIELSIYLPIGMNQYWPDFWVQQINEETEEKVFSRSQEEDSRACTKKYKKYSWEQKQKIVNLVHEGRRTCPEPKAISFFIHKYAKQFGIHPKNIYRWVDSQSLDGRESGRKAQYPQLEKNLVAYIKSNPNAKRKDIINEAKNMMKYYYNDEGGFSFSKGWFERFKKRHKIGKLSKYHQRMESLSQQTTVQSLEPKISGDEWLAIIKEEEGSGEEPEGEGDGYE